MVKEQNYIKLNNEELKVFQDVLDSYEDLENEIKNLITINAIKAKYVNKIFKINSLLNTIYRNRKTLIQKNAEAELNNASGKENKPVDRKMGKES